MCEWGCGQLLSSLSGPVFGEASGRTKGERIRLERPSFPSLWALGWGWDPIKGGGLPREAMNSQGEGSLSGPHHCASLEALLGCLKEMGDPYPGGLNEKRAAKSTL